jgi:phosphoribosylformylglycinamidine cyclo-ligase
VKRVADGLTYADSGVDRKLRAKAKNSLKALKKTYKFNPYGEMLQLPYGNVFPAGDRWLDLVIEGVGTKVLLAQLADKYDTIGIDGVAMAVNDVLRSGARPLAIADNIHAQASDPTLVREWVKGLVKGAVESQCVVAGGEIGDVADIIKGVKRGKGFDFVVACIGEVTEDKIIRGNNIKPNDVVIGLRSSGIHSNGIALARKVLFKEWGGRFGPHERPEGLERELIHEVLEPTRIYVKPLKEVMKKYEVKGAVHVTGDAYLKFGRFAQFSKGIGFELYKFSPQPIFDVIQKAAAELGGITDEEMLKTFNMGWGFALVVDGKDQDGILQVLERSMVESEVIGKATSEPGIVADFKGKKLALK